MSDLALPPPGLPVEPLHVAVRRLRWFRAAFRSSLDSVGAEIGCEFELDELRQAGAFVRWLRRAEAQKPRVPEERRSFFDFATGLMLRELMTDMPIRALAPPRNVAPDSPAAFWPEGYAATMFCLALHDEMVSEEFDAQSRRDATFGDLRTWWSFRENIEEDPVRAIGFMDLFLGNEPEWTMPDSFARRVHHDQITAVRRQDLAAEGNPRQA